MQLKPASTFLRPPRLVKCPVERMSQRNIEDLAEAAPQKSLNGTLSQDKRPLR